MPAALKAAITHPLAPQIFTLKNGLPVMLFEESSERDLTLRLHIGGGNAADAQDKEGTAELIAEWLNHNARNSIRDAVPPLDTAATRFIARAEPDAMIITLSGAPQRFPTLITLLLEAAAQPVFLRADMETLRERVLQRVVSAHHSVEYLLDAMSARVLLGEAHPYARRAGETSLFALTVGDVKEYHQSFFLPNNASLAVIGAMSKKELQPLLERVFKNWKPGSVPRLPDLTPRPLPQGIYLVEAPNARYVRGGRIIPGLYMPVDSTAAHPGKSKQSTVQDSTARIYPAVLFASLGAPVGAFDEEAMLQTLSSPEEQYLPNKFATRLVPTFITAIQGFERIIARIGKGEHPVQDFLPAEAQFPARQARHEQALRRLTDSLLTRAILCQTAQMNGIRPEYALQAPERAKAITLADVREAASKYLSTARLTMIVIGGGNEVLNPLLGLGVAQSREVYRYSEELELLLTFEKPEYTLQELLGKHLAAVGGSAAVASLRTLIATSELQLSAMGQKFPGTIITKHKVPNKISRVLEVPATQMLQALWYDGAKAFDKIEMMGSEQPLQQRQAKETESALFDAQIFPLLALSQCGFTAELLGKREGQFVIKASAPNGTVKTLSLDETTFLLSKIEETRQTPQGIIKSVQEFRDYDRVAGVQLPSVIVLRTGPGTLIGKTKYQVNTAIADDEFMPR